MEAQRHITEAEAAAFYADELEGTRVRLPGSALPVHATAVTWGTTDWKDDRTLLSIVLTPAQAVALGIEFLYVEANDRRELEQGGYQLPPASAPAKAAPRPVAKPVRRAAPPTTPAPAGEGYLSLDAATLQQIASDPFRSLSLHALDLEVKAEQLRTDFEQLEHTRLQAIELLREACSRLDEIADNRARFMAERAAGGADEGRAE